MLGSLREFRHVGLFYSPETRMDEVSSPPESNDSHLTQFSLEATITIDYRERWFLFMSANVTATASSRDPLKTGAEGSVEGARAANEKVDELKDREQNARGEPIRSTAARRCASPSRSRRGKVNTAS